MTHIVLLAATATATATATGTASEELEGAAGKDLGSAHGSEPGRNRLAAQEGRGKAYQPVIRLLEQPSVLPVMKPLNAHFGNDSSRA